MHLFGSPSGVVTNEEVKANSKSTNKDKNGA
jgi:hypothetical protein